jgi:3'(2'), 5'-bisphosphate nucleotidase
MKNTFLIAIEAAIQAGKKILKIYNNQNYEIHIKRDNSPVTQADRESSAVIARYLKTTRIPVIDEELGYPDYAERKSWKKLWLVDPMDGTKEFISRNGEFTVNIALIENCIPVFGVIYSPVLNELYYGGPNLGVYKIRNIPVIFENNMLDVLKEPLQPNLNIGSHIRIAASRSHLDEYTSQYIKKLQLVNPMLDFITKGSSLKLCMIAEGLVDIYPRFSRTMEWDTAAGQAIVSGAGGLLLNAKNGCTLVYNKEDLANPSFAAFSANIQYELLEWNIENRSRNEYFHLKCYQSIHTCGN